MSKKNVNRYTVGRCIAMLIIAMSPMLVLVVAAAVLFGGFISNIAFAWTFFLLPLLVMYLDHKTIFSERGIGEKIACVICIYLVAIPVFLFSTFVGKYEMKWVDRDQELTQSYMDFTKDTPFLPSPESVGNPNKKQHIEYESIQAVFFNIHVDALICSYTSEAYVQQKQRIDEQSSFRLEPYTYGEFVCEPAVSIDGYHFRMLDSPDVSYPHRLSFIATNDETCEIVWLSFIDDDLDYIADLSEFLLENCGWAHMR